MIFDWDHWKQKRKLTESKGQKPDYSFDNWLKQVKSFGDNVNSMVDKSKEVDKEIEDKKKQSSNERDADSDNDNKETAWNKLKEKAKEKAKAKKKDKDTKEEDSSESLHSS